MNNLNSISEYQKIIFSKGLDESSIGVQSLNGIKNISGDYPFVVFITNLPNDASIDGNYPITNLWVEGKRLTRFIGIKKDNSEIHVGNHTLQLKFDYESGLLGIYDKNTLDRIEIYQCSFKNINGVVETQLYNNGTSFIINAIDNEFNIKYKFVGTDDTDNISNVSKSLVYDDLTYFSEENTESDTPESNKEQYVTVSYLIKESTYDVEKTIGYESTYSDDASTNDLKLKLYLNPKEYNILINDNDIKNNGYINCENNKSYSIKLNFAPSNINSFNEHQIYVKLTANNVNIVGSSIAQIIGGTCSFTIQTPSVQFNSYLNAELNFEVKYVLNNDNVEHTYNGLSKTINVIISGDQSDKYFYFGYENPMNDNFDISLLQNIGEIGSSILYDGFNDLIDHTDDTFYCAIPYAYKELVKPRWYAWENSKPNYLECTSWFTYNEKIINGINYVVYTRRKTGNFYGLIK